MPKKIELTAPVAIIICGVIIAAAIVFVNRYPGPVGAAVAQNAPAGGYAQANVPAPSDADHVYGSRTAKVFLIEYSDFQCVFCARAYPTFKRLVDESSGEVALIHRHFPLESIHPAARGGAIASECVAAQLGDSGFWLFADAMFADNGSGQGAMGDAYFASAAGSLGINPIAYNTCVASGAYDALIDRHSGEAFASGGTGTPFTVVYAQGGAQVPVSGAVPYEQFRSVIEAVKTRQ